MSEMMTHGFMRGVFCPACGDDNLRRKQDGRLVCTHPRCPDIDAAHKVLSDSEIHHIVRFDEDGYYNAKHPLRERIGDELLTCAIGDEVMRWMGTPTQARKGEVADTTWRVRAAGEHNLDRDYMWDQIV